MGLYSRYMFVSGLCYSWLLAFIHVVMWISRFFLLITEQESLVLESSHFIHLPVGRHLGCFQFGRYYE